MTVKKSRTRVRQKTQNDGSGGALQAPAKTGNVKAIMAKYQRTGLIPQVQVQPVYGDVSKAGDYVDAMNLVRQTTDMFMALPAEVRKQFDHSPEQFLAFAENSENEQKMIEMGLKEAPVVETAPEPSIEERLAALENTASTSEPTQ